MPRKCSVSGCRTNYNLTKGKSSTATFGLPKDETLREQWLKAIPNDISQLKCPIVCIKHFEEHSIIRGEGFFNKGELKILKRTLPKLTPGAVPTLFPDHLSTVLSGQATPSHVVVEVKLVGLQKPAPATPSPPELLASFDEVVDYIKSKPLPAEWVHYVKGGTFKLCVMDDSDCPTVTSSLTIHSDLRFELFVNKVAKSAKDVQLNSQIIGFKSDVDSIFNFISNKDLPDSFKNTNQIISLVNDVSQIEQLFAMYEVASQ